MSTFKTTRTAALALGLVALTFTARAANETHVYGISKFGGRGECGSSSMTHSVHARTAAAFRSWFDIMRMVGKWDVSRTINDKNAASRYFTDAGNATSCSCKADDSNGTRGADAADVIYVHTHGSHSTGTPGSSSLSMGSSAAPDVCSASTNSHMKWNGDLDVAVIKACQSGDYDVWKSGGYFSFVDSRSSLRMWNAFHGDSSCGDHVTAYVSWYAMTSFHDGIGENWLDAAYEPWAGSDNDDCPVSIVFGETAAKRANMFWNGGWKDRKDTGTMRGSTYYYFEGCNPKNGVKLPG